MALNKRFMWSINASSIEQLNFGESKLSRKFVTVKDHVSYTWRLKLYPKGLKINTTDSPNLHLFIVFLSGPKESVFVNCTQTGDRNLVGFNANLSKSGLEYKIGAEIPALLIAPQNIAANFTAADASGNRQLIVNLSVGIQPELFTNLPFTDVLEPAPFHSLDRLLLKVLSGDEDKLSDYSIIAGQHSYATNRCILATRCPYFEQFFIEGGEDWVEKANKQLNAPVGKRAMDQILRYIYTDRIIIPRSDSGVDVVLVQELVCAADYFRLPELQKHYERPLYEYLIANQSNNKTALSLFIFADRYGFKLLKNCAMSVLHEQFDSIEEYVSNLLSNPAGLQPDVAVDKEDEILAMWKTLKQNRSDNINLIDEVYAFNRQIYVTQL